MKTTIAIPTRNATFFMEVCCVGAGRVLAWEEGTNSTLELKLPCRPVSIDIVRTVRSENKCTGFRKGLTVLCGFNIRIAEQAVRRLAVIPGASQHFDRRSPV